jgi:tRNAThr (cytosine32-N3)-methyltransferase
MSDQIASAQTAPVELAQVLPASTNETTQTNGQETSSSEIVDGPSDETPAERRERLHKVPFGSRFLTEQDDVFSHNAWDHVVPPPEWEDDAKKTLEMQRQAQVSKEMKCEFQICHAISVTAKLDRFAGTYNANPAMYWHRFYNINKAKYVK